MFTGIEVILKSYYKIFFVNFRYRYRSWIQGSIINSDPDTKHLDVILNLGST